MGYDLTDKIKIHLLKNNSWDPKNFSNQYEGIISIKRAFAISSNVAAVRLAEKVGRENIIKQAKKLG